MLIATLIILFITTHFCCCFRYTRRHPELLQNRRWQNGSSTNSIRSKLHGICTTLWLPRRQVQQKTNHGWWSATLEYDDAFRIVHAGEYMCIVWSCKHVSDVIVVLWFCSITVSFCCSERWWVSEKPVTLL